MTKQKIATLIIISVMAIMLINVALAIKSFPRTTETQGELTNQTTGNPINDSRSVNFNMTYVYGSNDTHAYSESVSITVGSDGVVNRIAGNSVTLDPKIFKNDLIQKKIRIDSNEFSTVNISAVEYAFTALFANDTDFLGSLPFSEYVTETSLALNFTAHNESMKLYVDNQGFLTTAVTNASLEITESQISDLKGHTNLTEQKVLEYVNNSEVIINCDNINFTGTVGSAGICDGNDASSAGGSSDLNLTDGSTEIVITDDEVLTITPAGPLSIAASGNTMTFTANEHTNRSDTDITGLCYDTEAELTAVLDDNYANSTSANVATWVGNWSADKASYATTAYVGTSNSSMKHYVDNNFVNAAGGTFTGDVVFDSDINVSDRIYRKGDTDTYIDISPIFNIVEDGVSIFQYNSNTLLLNPDDANDVRIDSSNNNNMVYVDNSADKVYIGTNTGSEVMTVNGNLSATTLYANSWPNVTITESQITDLQSYLITPVNNASIEITESQISDLQSYLTTPVTNASLEITESQISDLKGHTNRTDADILGVINQTGFSIRSDVRSHFGNSSEMYIVYNSTLNAIVIG